MFNFDVSQIDQRYKYRVTHVSSMINPKDNTVMFLTPKNLDEAGGIDKCNNCLIFVPEECEVKTEWHDRHCIRIVDNPRLEYALLVNDILSKTPPPAQNYELINGSYISKDAKIGVNVVIEPFCVINREVKIGDGTVIKSGVKISGKVTIGKGCIIYENCVVGANALNVVKNAQRNNVQVPRLGSVRIEDNVEVGSMSRIEMAMADETVIHDSTKISLFSSIGHETNVGRNNIIVQSVIGGHVVLGHDVYLGMGTKIKQRLKIGSNAYIGMGSIVMKDVPEGVAVAGNPARQIKR